MGASGVIITPEPKRHKEIGQALYVLAAEMGIPASAITWTTWPTTGYRVPEELFERFENPDGVLVESPPEPAPAGRQKRRGRPRKHAAAGEADNNHSEEE